MTALSSVSVLLLAAVAAPAAPVEPGFVAQTQPVAQMLADVRKFVQLTAGHNERVVKNFDEGLKRTFGEKGLEGLDLNRPLAAYATLAEDPEKSTAVVVLPIGEEKDFVALVERLEYRTRAVDGRKGLFEIHHCTGGDPPVPLFLRMAEGTAYLSVNDPEGQSLDPARLLLTETLVKPGDPALIAVRAFPGRLPAKLVKVPFDKFKAMGMGNRGMMVPGMFGLGGPELMLALGLILPASPHIDAVLADGQEVALRVSLSPAAEVAVELTVTPKPGSPLAAKIAAAKPNVNRFAGLIGKETAVGLALTLPFSSPEVRDRTLELVQLGDKVKGIAPPDLRTLVDEILKGLARTAKAGDASVAGSLGVPDEKGRIHAVGAVSFEDTAGLEKAVRDFVGNLPEESRNGITLDAGKVGDVNLHVMKVGPMLDDLHAFLFTREATLCLAFAPTAIYAAIGPDARSAVRAAMAAKAGPAAFVDMPVNGSRVHKLIASVAAREGEAVAKRAAQLMGAEDRTAPALSVSAEGGAEFKYRFTVAPRLFPRWQSWETKAIGEKE